MTIRLLLLSKLFIGSITIHFSARVYFEFAHTVSRDVGGRNCL